MIEKARNLLASSEHGILSTLSVYLGGFPFGSVVNHCLDQEGRPMVLISTIAQHTKNVQSDDRVSLTITENGGGNVQAESRITIAGHLVKAEDQKKALQRYQRYFPESITYLEFHDFEVFVLKPSAVRYIGGFGQIHWIEPSEFFDKSPFSEESEKFIIDHMNESHQDSLEAYLKHFCDIQEEQEVTMIGIDRFGFDLRLKKSKARVLSPEPISDPKKAREILVQMSKEAMLS